MPARRPWLNQHRRLRKAPREGSQLTTYKIYGIILAAGLATRMGRAKLLLEIEGVPMLIRVVTAAVESSLDRVILVTGPTLRWTDIPRLSDMPISIVENPLPEQGMSSSIKSGIGLLSGDVGGAMIILADQPRITPGIMDLLLEEFRKDSDKIVAPAVRGRRTTPVVFPQWALAELAKTRGDVGGRNVLKRYPDRVVTLDMTGFYDDTDIDTPQDLQRIAHGNSSKQGER